MKKRLLSILLVLLMFYPSAHWQTKTANAEKA